MAFLEIKDYSFTYAGGSCPALRHIDGQIAEGDFVLLCGSSGSGKTTLLRSLKKELQPIGQSQGAIYYQGALLDRLAEQQAISEIGFVFQNPEQQIVLEDVRQELAFSLGNLAFSQDVMRRRIGEMANFFGLRDLLDLPTETLSGGQKQRINLAAVLLIKPKLLLLDEPTSQLDPIAASEFLQMLRQINEELGVTILISEHRLEAVLPLVNRVVFLNDGQLQEFATPRAFCTAMAQNKAYAAYLPSIPKLYLRSANQGDAMPLLPKEAYLWAKNYAWRYIPKHREEQKIAKPLLQAKEISFRYEKEQADVLQSLSCQIAAGEIAAVLGGTGVGKSTLLKLLAGLLSPQRGQILLAEQKLSAYKKEERSKQIGYMGQEPHLYFVCSTVKEELAYGLSAEEAARLPQYLDRLQIGDILAAHPYDVSAGQQQKVVLANLLCRRPQVLLLDEPTKGLDPVAKEQLRQILTQLAAEGMAILIASHDCEFVAAVAQKAALLFDNELTVWQNSADFFHDNYFYTTALGKVFGRLLRQTPLSAEEVQQICE